MAIIAQSPNGEQREFVAIMKAALLSNKMVEQNTNPYMGVSKNRDTPKWMVCNGKPY